MKKMTRRRAKTKREREGPDPDLSTQEIAETMIGSAEEILVPQEAAREDIAAIVVAQTHPVVVTGELTVVREVDVVAATAETETETAEEGDQGAHEDGHAVQTIEEDAVRQRKTQDRSLSWARSTEGQ